MKCRNCGKTIIDGCEYIGVKEKNFCSVDCAKEYFTNNPKEAVEQYVADYAEVYDHEFDNPYA